MRFENLRLRAVGVKLLRFGPFFAVRVRFLRLCFVLKMDFEKWKLKACQCIIKFFKMDFQN